MLNDAHDTNITFAAKWLAGQLAQLQNNSYVMDNTLFMLTFDEIETYKNGNKIFALLFGGAIPANLKGTKDDTFYNHYSMISTVSANWGLPSLGRWDCEANVLALVADKTGITNAKVDTTNLYFNQSMPGPLSNNKYTPVWPAPATNLKCISGNGVLPAVMKAWNGTTPTYNYTNVYPYDSKSGLNTGGQVNGSKPGSATSASATPGLAAGTLPQIWAVAVAAFAASIAALYL
jgi:acid phosphatase